MCVKSWTEISEERLRANYEVLRRVAGSETPVLAVVKANAYGHGIEACAPVLARAGAEWLGDCGCCERDCGACGSDGGGDCAGRTQPRVLVMYAPLREDVDAIVEHGLTPVVWTRQQMEWLAEAVERRGVKEPFASACGDRYGHVAAGGGAGGGV